MVTKIPVLLINGTAGRVYPKELDRLLEAHQVKLFRRDAGWVMVGDAPLRNQTDEDYKGPERRSLFKTRRRTFQRS